MKLQEVEWFLFPENSTLSGADFMEDPPKKYFRLGPGRNVRLKGAYILNCTGFEKDETGKITEIHCTYYPDSKSGSDTSGVKAKGTLHWVSVAHALKAEVRKYDRLFTDPQPTGHPDKDYMEFLNPNSLTVLENSFIEPYLKDAGPGNRFQFMRMGYFCVDPDSKDGKLVFNQTVTLKDSWKKKVKK